jgi:transketolase
VIEAGVSECWWRFAGPGGRIIGLDRYGESAPAPTLFEHFGFTVRNVLSVAGELLGTADD